MKNELIMPNMTVEKLPDSDEIEKKLPYGLILGFTAIPDEGIGGIGETSIAKLISGLLPDVQLLETGSEKRKFMSERLGRKLTEDEFERERNSLTTEESNEIDRRDDIKFAQNIKDTVYTDGMVIFASKIASILMSHSEELDNMPSQEALRIIVGVMTVPQVAIQRIIGRQNLNGEVINDIANHRRKRLEGDQKIFEEAYPDIKCLNPYEYESVLEHVNFVLDNSIDVPPENWKDFGKSILTILTKEIPQITPLILDKMGK
jgi:hypothetical protein